MSPYNYSIAPSDMAFHALTTSLYKDRLRAPVREILSNAIDIQRRIGNEQPIEIKLPTPLDSQFRIRDFGSGLSRKDMARLYSSLFSSDKHLTRANEVGGFGVGAKSPFAYTDAFTVESFHNGQRTIYSAFMDGNRAPQLLELFQEDTLEPNGLAVSYPVLKSDEEKLRSIVRQEVALCGHPVECLGISDEVIVLEKNPKFEKIANAWLGSDNTIVPNSRDTGAYGRMGNVLYPLEEAKHYPADLRAAMKMFNTIRREISRDHGSWRIQKKDETGRDWDSAIIDLPIGSVRPAMSREELVTNDELTVAGLRQAYSTLLGALYQRTIDSKDLDACERLYDSHDALFLGKPSLHSRQFPFGLSRRHDFLEDHGDKSRQHGKTSGSDKKIPSEDSSLKASWLLPQYEALEKLVVAYRAEKQVWLECSFMAHPRMIHELHLKQQYGGFSMGTRSPKNHDGHDETSMFMSGFMPVEAMRHERSQIDMWTNKDVELILMPFNAHAPEWAETFQDVVTRGEFGHSRGDSDFDSFDAFVEDTKTINFMATLATIEDVPNSRRAHDFVVIVARSMEHENQLLALADENQRTLNVLDLDRRKIVRRNPDAPAFVSSDANPYGAAAAMELTAPMQAYYWDHQTQAVQLSPMSKLPTYWIIGPDPKKDRHSEFSTLVQEWQKKIPDGETLYILPWPHPFLEGHTKALSEPFLEIIQACSIPKELPYTPIQWMLGSIKLPPSHPLAQPGVVNDWQWSNAIEKIEHAYSNFADYIKYYHHHDRQDPKLFLSTLGDLPQRPSNVRYLNDVKFDTAFLARYPLLKNVMDAEQGKTSSNGSDRLATYGTRLANGIIQYIALVDKIHPEMPPALLSKYKELPVDAQTGPTA